MAGKDNLSNAVLGGSSDYLLDISKNTIKLYFAQGEEKVFKLIINNVAIYNNRLSWQQSLRRKLFLICLESYRNT